MNQNFLPLELRERSQFLCPICGDEIFSEYFISLCPHVIFIYQYVGVEFIIGETQHQQWIKQMVIYAYNTNSDPLETIMSLFKAPNIIFFEVTFYSMELEPSENILTIGFDLSY